MIKEYIKSHKEIKTVCKSIREESQKIRESIKANGVILDQAFSNDVPPKAYP